MAKEPVITIVGNLTQDPELRFTSSGVPMAKFTVANTPSHFDKTTNSWVDGETAFMQCTVWRQGAENAADSLRKGHAVIVSGRLHSRSYETKEGTKRTVMEIEVDSFGPDLMRATATVTKNASRAAQGGSAPTFMPNGDGDSTDPFGE